MARVICQVVAQDGHVSLTWGDGTGDFKPYHFGGLPLKKLQESTRKCRECLRDMVQDYLAWVNAEPGRQREADEERLRATCLGLARAGHDLYQRLFKPNKEDAEGARHLADGVNPVPSSGSNSPERGRGGDCKVRRWVRAPRQWRSGELAH